MSTESDASLKCGTQWRSGLTVNVQQTIKKWIALKKFFLHISLKYSLHIWPKEYNFFCLGMILLSWENIFHIIKQIFQLNVWIFRFLTQMDLFAFLSQS